MGIVLKYKDRTVSDSMKSMSLSEVALFFLTLLLWIDRILLTYIRAIMMRIPIVGFMTDYLILAAYILLIVFSVPRILKRMRAVDGVFIFIIVTICLVNYIIFPENAAVLNMYLPNFLFLTFPLYCIGLSLDFEKVYPWLYRLSLLTIPAFTAYKLFISAPMTDVQSVYQGDMWSAYNLLPHVCVVAVAMLRKPGLVNIALTMMGVVMLASMGSRGPLLCTILAMAAYLLFFKKYKHPFLAGFLIVFVAVTVMLGLDTIMQLLYDIAKEAGLSVRIFEKYFEGSFSDSTGREVIAARLYERIAREPIFGYGIFADRVAVGTYAHHIVIELWHSFGVVLGSAILGGIIIVLLRAAKAAKKADRYALLFLPLLFAGFIKLFLSNSFLEEIYLFWLLGIAVNFIRSSKKLTKKYRDRGVRSV